MRGLLFSLCAKKVAVMFGGFIGNHYLCTRKNR